MLVDKHFSLWYIKVQPSFDGSKFWKEKSFQKTLKNSLTQSWAHDKISELLGQMPGTEPWKIYSNATLKILKEFQKCKSRNAKNEPKRLKKSRTVSKSETELAGCWFSSGFKLLTREFDPGSGWTLAACLTHASRTEFVFTIFSEWRT